MDFVVAIPSYQRAKKLRDQTLAFLRREEVPTEKIFVFVADEQEKKSYEKVLEPGSFGSLVVGVPTLHHQRNFIQNFFPQDQKILWIDDDIKKLKFKTSYRRLLPFVEEMFNLLVKEKLNLWGIYPVNNVFFLKERAVVGKLFCVHCFCGTINTKDVSYMNSCVDDKYLSLFRYVADGAVLRYDGACPDTVYNAKGGLTEHRALFRTQEVRELQKTYPELCQIKKKANGREEVVWRSQYKKILSLSPYQVITDDTNGNLHEGTG